MTTIDESKQDEYFDLLQVEIKKIVPGFEVGYKSESIFHKILSVFLFLNKEYMKSVTSVFKYKVSFPSREFVNEDRWRAFKILAHEFVHILDRKESWLFSVVYSFPQNIVVFSLLALLAIPFSNWWLFSFVAFGFLAPWIAPGRFWLEMRGYAMGLAINMWKYGSVLDKKRNDLKVILTGPVYYYMSWNDNGIDQYIDEIIKLSADDKNGECEDLFEWSSAFGIVHRLITGIDRSQ